VRSRSDGEGCVGPRPKQPRVKPRPCIRRRRLFRLAHVFLLPHTPHPSSCPLSLPTPPRSSLTLPPHPHYPPPLPSLPMLSLTSSLTSLSPPPSFKSTIPLPPPPSAPEPQPPSSARVRAGRAVDRPPRYEGSGFESGCSVRGSCLERIFKARQGRASWISPRGAGAARRKREACNVEWGGRWASSLPWR